jgi:hypothetical protein
MAFPSPDGNKLAIRYASGDDDRILIISNKGTREAAIEPK